MVKNKDRWSALSMSERADLIKLYVSNGITSLDTIKKDYNSFGNGGNTWEKVDSVVEKAEPWVSGASLALLGATVVAPEAGIVTVPAMVVTNTAGTLMDGYQAVRDFQKGDYTSGVWNGIEALAGAFGSKAASKLARTKGGRAIGKLKEQLVRERFNSSGDSITRLMRKGLTYEQAAERVMQNAVNYVDNSGKFKDAAKGIRDYYNESFGTGADIVDAVFDAKDVGMGVYSGFKEEHPVEIYKCGGKLNSFGNGGRILDGESEEEQTLSGNKSWINRRVLDAVPGDQGRFGTQNAADAIFNLAFKPKGAVDKRIQRAENAYNKYKDWIEEGKFPKQFSSEKEWLNSLPQSKIDDIYLALDINKIKQHEDAKRIYLGYNPKYGTMEKSLYKPTIGKGDNTEYYQVNPLLSDEEFENVILPLWGEWKNPEYSTTQIQNISGNYVDYPRVTNKGNVAAVIDVPYLRNATLSEGYDNNGQYISLYDIWDYNTKNKSGDNIGKFIGGKPFEIYQRYYLDDWLDIPKEARGNPFIAPAVVTAEQKALGGPLYNKHNPIESFSGSSKIPVVRKSLTRR